MRRQTMNLSKILAASMLCVLLCTGCENKKLEPLPVEVVNHTPLVPIETGERVSYAGEVAMVQPTITSVQSDNQLVRIDKKESYYEVWLDLEKGSHYDCGSAYADSILKIMPDYVEVMEPYLFENIDMTFHDLDGDYSVIQKRVEHLLSQISTEYVDEMKGFAEIIGNGKHGIARDGAISEEEAMLIQLIPDVIRPTQCCAAAVYGDRSSTGSTITARILEWPLGNESQMAKVHAVVHFKQKEKSFDSYTVLGLFNALSVYNDSGVFLAILDSDSGSEYVSEKKSSYTFAVREAAENFTKAEEAARYLALRGSEMTFSHNVFVTDASRGYVAEICPDKEAGISAVRSEESKLMQGLNWNASDAICVVNGFALNGNYDNMTGSRHNLIRWSMFDEGLSKKDKISCADMKDVLTSVDPNNINVSKLYSNYTFQMILIDAATGEVEIAFAPNQKEFSLHPQFVKVH